MERWFRAKIGSGSIITVLASDIEEARLEVLRHLEHPGREAILLQWERLGSPVEPVESMNSLEAADAACRAARACGL